MEQDKKNQRFYDEQGNPKENPYLPKAYKERLYTIKSDELAITTDVDRLTPCNTPVS